MSVLWAVMVAGVAFPLVVATSVRGITGAGVAP